MPSDGLKRQLYSAITVHLPNKVCVEENIHPSSQSTILYLILSVFSWFLTNVVFFLLLCVIMNCLNCIHEGSWPFFLCFFLHLHVSLNASTNEVNETSEEALIPMTPYTFLSYKILKKNKTNHKMSVAHYTFNQEAEDDSTVTLLSITSSWTFWLWSPGWPGSTLGHTCSSPSRVLHGFRAHLHERKVGWVNEWIKPFYIC